MKKKGVSDKQNHPADKLLLGEIREIILSARNTVVRNVDTIQVITNYEIGRRIVNYEQGGKTRAQYGGKILAHLSKKLIQEFGRGFSTTNLKLMRQFFLLYGPRIGQTMTDQLLNNQKGQTLSDQLPKTQTPFLQLLQSKSKSLPRKFTLSWSHYVF